MTSFNTTTRVPELSAKKPSRKASKNDHERMNVMRRIEAIKELKALGFTSDEIKAQLDSE
ncbi:thyroid hormone receptor interactor 11-like protein [Shewanella sp. S23-S33]|uniref:thyroid hormone receptor interactor 11-like protein n=1 Tax=Shewanella sp. S23-S33 TaxID=3342769 RepID=UPI00372D464E